MDTTEQYIKQCEQAPKIQEAWQPQDFDFVMGEYVSVIRTWDVSQGIGKASLNPVFTNKGKIAWYYKEELIFLPKQDQLQDMMNNNSPHPTSYIINELNIFVRGIRQNFISMEQLWLAFVMQEKYQKSWHLETEMWE